MRPLKREKFDAVLEVINWPGLTFYDVKYKYWHRGYLETATTTFNNYQEAKNYFNNINNQ